MFEVEYFTLDATNMSNKYVSLSGVPVSAGNIALDTIGGTSQFQSGDFDVTDQSNVDWDGLGLDGYLTSGDKLRVIYDKS